MPDFVVSTAFTAIDGITQTLKNMGVNATKFGNRADSAFSRASRRATSFGAITKGILTAGVIQRGFGLMQQGIRGVVEEFINFDDAITSAAAKFPEGIKRGTKEFKELQMAAREVGKNTKFSATEAGEGLNFLAMAGFNAKQSMAALPQVTDLAIAADIELAEASDIASDALGSFGLMTKDSTKLTENLARINDVFAKTVTTSNTTLVTLFETMKDAGPVITGAGQSIETFAALTGQLGSAGIKGTKAGTTLKNMFLKLQKPVPKAAAELKKLRITVLDENKDLKDMITLIGEFERKTKDMGKAQRAAALSTIFGERAIAGANVLLDVGEEKLKAYRDQLEASRGSANQMARDIEKSLGNKLLALKSAAIEIGLQFFDTFEKQIPGAINAAIEAVRTFDVKSVVENLRSVFKFLKETWRILKDLKPAIELGITLWLSYAVALKGVLFVEAIRGFMAVAKATQVAAGAQGILNAAILANPLGMLVAALALSITAVVLWYRNWDEIWDGLKYIWTMMVVNFKGSGNAMEDIFAKMWVSIFKSWDAAGNAMEDSFAKMWVDIFKSIESVKRAFSGLWEDLKSNAKTTLKAVANLLNPLKWFFDSKKGRAELITKETSPAIVEAARGERLEERRVPPNVAREEARKREQIGFEGRLTVAGAPPGSTLETTTTGAPPIQTEMLGANL